jgi:hypothetical protein
LPRFAVAVASVYFQPRPTLPSYISNFLLNAVHFKHSKAREQPPPPPPGAARPVLMSWAAHSVGTNSVVRGGPHRSRRRQPTPLPGLGDNFGRGRARSDTGFLVDGGGAAATAGSGNGRLSRIKASEETILVRGSMSPACGGGPGTDPEPVAFFRPHFRAWVAPR